MSEDTGSQITITRGELTQLVAHIVAMNRAVAVSRPTGGARALDHAIEALYDDGEIELAAALAILHGMRVLGPHAVATALNGLFERWVDLDPATFLAWKRRSN